MSSHRPCGSELEAAARAGIRSARPTSCAAENLEMKMRPGGHEMENVVTHAPGCLEFLPNLPQRHRNAHGNDMLIAYGAQNRIDTFHATDAKTQTEPNVDEHKRNRAVSITSSQELLARFDPRPADVVHGAEGRFHLRGRRPQGPRAQQGHARFAQNVILLEAARACGMPAAPPRRPHPHGPAHRRFRRRRQRQLQPHARKDPKKNSHAHRRRAAAGPGPPDGVRQ